MSRSRNIKPAFFKNELLVELPFEARLLFIGLWTMADREGRLEDRPVKIKMELFPADSVDIESGLSGLAEKGFIKRYEVDGTRYLQINAFTKHQSPHPKEAPSIIPEPCKATEKPRLATESNGLAHLIPSSLIPSSLIPDCPAKPDAPSAEKKLARKKKTPMPEGFKVSDRVLRWAELKGHDRLDVHFESFTAKCKAHGYAYADWDEAFMEAIRANWAKLEKSIAGRGSSPVKVKTPEQQRQDKIDGLRHMATLGNVDAARELHSLGVNL